LKAFTQEITEAYKNKFGNAPAVYIAEIVDGTSVIID